MCSTRRGLASVFGSYAAPPRDDGQVATAIAARPVPNSVRHPLLVPCRTESIIAGEGYRNTAYNPAMTPISPRDPGNRNVVARVYREAKSRTSSFSSTVVTSFQKWLKIGCSPTWGLSNSYSTDRISTARFSYCIPHRATYATDRRSREFVARNHHYTRHPRRQPSCDITSVSR